MKRLYLNAELPEIVDELRNQEENNKSDVEKFLKLSDLELLAVDYTYEFGKYELMYYFSDNLGGYTIQGIRDSIDQ